MYPFHIWVNSIHTSLFQFLCHVLESSISCCLFCIYGIIYFLQIETFAKFAEQFCNFCRIFSKDLWGSNDLSELRGNPNFAGTNTYNNTRNWITRGGWGNSISPKFQVPVVPIYNTNFSSRCTLWVFASRARRSQISEYQRDWDCHVPTGLAKTNKYNISTTWNAYMEVNMV